MTLDLMSKAKVKDNSKEVPGGIEMASVKKMVDMLYDLLGDEEVMPKQ